MEIHNFNQRFKIYVTGLLVLVSLAFGNTGSTLPSRIALTPDTPRSAQSDVLRSCPVPPESWSSNVILEIQTTGIDSFIDFDWLSGNWVAYEKHSFSYAQEPATTQEVIQVLEQGTWTNDLKVSMVQDLNGNVIEEKIERWTEGAWRNSERTLFSFNGNDSLLEKVTQFWEVWDWSNELRYSYSYNEAGQRLIFSFQEWSDLEWLNAYRWEASYSTNGRRLYDVKQNWRNGSWENDIRHGYSYDGSGYMTQDLETFWWDPEWSNNYQTLYSYDPNGELSEQTYQVWYDDQWHHIDRHLLSYVDQVLFEDETQRWISNAWESWERFNYTYNLNGSLTEARRSFWWDPEWMDEFRTLYSYTAQGHEQERRFQIWYGSGWTNIDLRISYYPVTTGINQEGPNSYSLAQNYPNPFNPTTSIEYTLPHYTEVQFKILDLKGREVVTLISENQVAGVHHVQWHAAGAASGIYFYQLKTPEFSQTRRLLLLK